MSKDNISADFDWKAFNSLNLIQRMWKKSMAKNVWRITEGDYSRVLDIGCGSSRIITHFNNAVGIDIDKNKIEYMKKINKNIEFEVMDCCNMEFGDKSFDTIICTEVIEHLEKPEKLLSEISRIVRNNGIVLIATPDTSKIQWRIIQWIYNILGAYKGQHITYYTLETLKESAKRYKLNYIQHKYIMSCDMLCVFNKGE